MHQDHLLGNAVKRAPTLTRTAKTDPRKRRKLAQDLACMRRSQATIPGKQLFPSLHGCYPKPRIYPLGRHMDCANGVDVASRHPPWFAILCNNDSNFLGRALNPVKNCASTVV